MKLSLNGLVGYLQGKGWKVKLNEDSESEEETFEITEEPTLAAAEEEDSDDTMITAEEMQALKGFAQVLAKNGATLTDALGNGTFAKALSTVPAAAALVKQNAEREKAEKDALITTIKANSSNIYSDEELTGMSNPVLVKLNAQMNVSYAGLGGGGYVQQNSEQPLVLQPMLLQKSQESE